MLIQGADDLKMSIVSMSVFRSTVVSAEQFFSAFY